MDVLEAIKLRRSVRSYDSRPIPPAVLEHMRQALRYAPSACNFQPWRFIFVTDAELRKQVARASNDQLWMADAPLTIVACGRLDQAHKRMRGHDSSVEVDVAIAVDHLTLAAVAEGLGTCWIGAFDEEKVKHILGIPPDVKLVTMTPLGYPASADLNRPITEDRRKPANEIFADDRYGS